MCLTGGENSEETISKLFGIYERIIQIEFICVSSFKIFKYKT